jgi:hypothetical protein
MDELRRPIFVLACGLISLAVLLEVGAVSLVTASAADDVALREVVETQFADELAPLNPNAREQRVQTLVSDLRQRSDEERPSGLAIPYLALLDGLVLFTALLIGAGLIVPERVQGKIQGLVTLIASVIFGVVGVLLVIVAIGLLTLMLALLFAAPFGTLIYFAIYGFFDRPGATLVLGVLLLLKLGFAVCLVLAQPRFLQNRGLVLLVLTALLGTVIVTFLHGIVPRPLVSITDAIAAIVVAILAIGWALFLLFGALMSFKRLAPPPALP